MNFYFILLTNHFYDELFVASNAKTTADSNIYLRKTKLANLAGLKVIRIHDFRLQYNK